MSLDLCFNQNFLSFASFEYAKTSTVILESAINWLLPGSKIQIQQFDCLVFISPSFIIFSL